MRGKGEVFNDKTPLLDDNQNAKKNNFVGGVVALLASVFYTVLRTLLQQLGLNFSDVFLSDMFYK